MSEERFRYVFRNKNGVTVTTILSLRDLETEGLVWEKIDVAGVAGWDVDDFDVVSTDRCTGLEDRNGREIFEGDVWRDPRLDSHFVVVYDAPRFKLVCGDKCHPEYENRHIWEGGEVVGNVENGRFNGPTNEPINEPTNVHEDIQRMDCYFEGNFDEHDCKAEDCEHYKKCLDDFSHSLYEKKERSSRRVEVKDYIIEYLVDLLDVSNPSFIIPRVEAILENTKELVKVSRVLNRRIEVLEETIGVLKDG